MKMKKTICMLLAVIKDIEAIVARFALALN